MDIFAELEKLRRPVSICEEAMGYSGKKCHCGNHKHNETLDGIIELLKNYPMLQSDLNVIMKTEKLTPVWIGLDLADKPDIGAEFTFENLEKVAQSVNALVMPDAPGDLVIGDYVFACRWSDADWNDPWAVGYVRVIGKNYVGIGQEDGRLIPKVGVRGFKYAIAITKEQGDKIIAEYQPMEGSPFCESVILDILSKKEINK